MSKSVRPAALLILVLFVSPSVFGDESDSKVKAAIASMHDEIAKLKVNVERDAKPLVAELKADPILHYTDPQRKFPDATLWAWTVEGQPMLFAKLERMGGNPPSSQYCIATAHNPRVTVRWPDGIAWKSRRAGVEFQKLEDADQPQKTPPLRLIQLRAIARKFRATTVDGENQKEEMRLLSQPILRYSNPGESLVDGAVFGLTSNGTNPDALLLTQVRQNKDEKAIWEFGIVGMTGDKVSVDLDGKVVYDHPGKPGPGDHGYWLWTVAPTE